MIWISDKEWYTKHTVSDFTNKNDVEVAMTDLLTTKQVQALLRVDRTTIYRMVDGGQLPAMRVGKQWRFARTDVERWLHAGRSAAFAPLAGGLQELSPSRESVFAAPINDGSLMDMLPVACAQAAQDAFADLLGATLIITDMQGRPITKISNPCGFFDALMAGNPDGLQHCVHTWQQMAGDVALEPKFSLSEMGLMCARGLIRVGAELKGMVVIGGIVSENWPPTADQADELAALFHVQPETVTAHSVAVFHMDRVAQERALRFVQRIADVFSQMIQARLQMPAHGTTSV